MRPLILLLLATIAPAQSAQLQPSHTTESLRGVSAVTHQVAWASGTHGTYLRTTDAGQHWQPAQVPGAEALDFRGVVAFSSDEAFLMSSGLGDQSRIYHTADAGQHWQLQFTAANPKAFFDSIAFWDAKHGIVLGDPIPDESGKLKFELMATDDGQTWHSISATLPDAIEGEGAFAASNSCIAILPTPSAIQIEDVTPNARQRERNPTAPEAKETANENAPQPAVAQKSGPSVPRKPATATGASAPDPNLWFATGGKAARVFRSPDRGKTWQVTNTPIVHGSDSAGIFSIAFRDATHGVIAGGDYKHPNQDGPNLAFTTDGGQTWTVSKLHPQVFFSAAAYDRRSANTETRNSSEPRNLFLAGPNFIFDFRTIPGPTRIEARIKPKSQFNALSPFPQTGVLAAGAKGAIFSIP